MHDLKFLRQNRDKVEAGIALKGAKLDLTRFYQIEERRLALLHETEQLKARRNAASDEIAKLKKAGQDAAALILEQRQLGDRVKEMDTELSQLDEESTQLAAWIPQLPHPSVPPGSDATSNQVVRTWGKAPTFDFEPKPHWELATNLGLLDFERSTKISGSGFLLFTGLGARIERALINFMLDFHTEKHGYTEVSPPHVIRRAALFGTGQLPKLEGDMYHIGEDDLFLNPTAEVPVTNIHREEILEAGMVPRYLTAHCASYRREAGAAGRDTRGMVRVHQFDKVELVKIVPPETSYDEHEKLARDVADIFARTAVSRAAAVQRRHELRGRQVLRLRGLVAGPAGVARVQLVLELRGLPVAPHGHALPPRGRRQGRVPAHAQRLGRGAAAHVRDDPREPSAGRRLGGDPEGAASVPRWARGDRAHRVIRARGGDPSRDFRPRLLETAPA